MLEVGQDLARGRGEDDAGGEVLGERYVAIGDSDGGRLIDEIATTRPSFILNNLIGPSSYAFLEAYAALGRDDRFFTPESCPLLSCNLTEAELPALNGVADGHLVVGPYFRKAAEANGWPLAGKRRCASSFEAAAYTAVAILADVLATAHGSRQADLQAAFSGRRFASPYGTVSVDPRTQHMALPVVIGRIAGPDVEALEITPSVAPDPYLSRYDRTLTFGRQTLRVVS